MLLMKGQAKITEYERSAVELHLFRCYAVIDMNETTSGLG